jgi:hypothetical protein
MKNKESNSLITTPSVDMMQKYHNMEDVINDCIRDLNLKKMASLTNMDGKKNRGFIRLIVNFISRFLPSSKSFKEEAKQLDECIRKKFPEFVDDMTKSKV